MIVIGITGSIGMGKTTAANMLRDMKIPVFDSDSCVHDLLAPGGAGVTPAGIAFPEAYDKKTKSIDRGRLRAALGGDHEKWNLLESLLHPLVQGAQQDWLRGQKGKGVKIAALDIPLLFETGAEARCDCVIAVSAPEFIQRQRVLEKMSEEDFAFRLSRQMPDEQKRMRADYVLNSGQGLAEMRRELQDIVSDIREKFRCGKSCSTPKPPGWSPPKATG
ncbi:MAG: dephospho-CoA kinase [Proteobacteria bacterium]|nr:dephospho-CoA kinase [Pseudomonadota bacterium]